RIRSEGQGQGESNLYFISVAIPQAVGPVNIVLLALAAWTITLSALVVFATKTRIPVFTTLTIVVIAKSPYPARCQDRAG
ncbi:hypothetical protein, partial [Mesorhizobium silamurunense]|uniref:hypothetical protein n=1 Tax=Mesorhizobium silamurunense TaxID=499528 RepID=UPI001AEE2702